MVVFVVGLALWLGLAHAEPLPTARTDLEAPPTAAELAAADRLRKRRCAALTASLVPGASQLCNGRPDEGAFALSLGLVELGALGAVHLATESPAPGEPPVPARLAVAVAYSDLWVYSLMRTSIDETLARRRLYAPPDELPQMLAAPFDPRVMRRPAVLGGILVLAAGGTALQYGLDVPTRFGGRPNLFGARPGEAVGYPAAFALHGVLMSHVAVAEEVAFRGLIQSWAARTTDETAGWVIGSAIFGPSHAFNALLLPEEERVPYLAVAVPWITLTGSWLGLVYRWGRYSLTGPIAVHWWYNMLVSATAFAADPEHNLFSATIRVRI